MTIMKAIAMAALAGTLLAGPGAAIAQTTEHGNSASAHMNNDARKAAHEFDKATRAAERDARKAAHQAAQTDEQDDQGVEDDGTTGDEGDNSGTSGDVGGGMTGGLQGHGHGKALGQPNFGTIVSSLHRNGGASSTLDLTQLSDTYTINEVDLSGYAGARMHAIDNALKNVSATDIQAQLSADAELTAAIEAELGTTDLTSVAYAYVDASGNLVVFTK